jgi:hypothetical protein
MTVATTKSAVSYLGNGVTTVFDFDFLIPSGALVVLVGGEAVSNGFTASGLGVATGGSVVFEVAPANGASVSITRSVPITQERSFVNGQAIYAKEIEGALDKLTMTAQDLHNGLERAVKVPVGDGGTGDDFAASLFAAGEDAADSAAAAEASAAAAASARDAAENYATQAEAAQAATLASQAVTSLSEAAGAASAAQAASSEATAESYSVAAAASAAAAAAFQAAAFDSQTEASASETAAAARAAEAASSAATAAAGRDATLAALDSFDDRYLGAKESPPAVDNDGDPLMAGALYYDTTEQAIKLWTGAAWVAAYVSGDGFLATANNLADLADVAAARSALGLATVAATGAYDDLTGKPDLTSGGILARARTSSSTYISSSASIPVDNTAPQIGEGLQVLSVSLTTQSASSVLKVSGNLQIVAPSGQICTAALFVDGAASAVYAVSFGNYGGYANVIPLSFEMPSAGAKPTTFSLRVGSEGGNWRLNTRTGGGADALGGILASSLIVEEILVG